MATGNLTERPNYPVAEPAEWKIPGDSPDYDRTKAIIAACRAGAQAKFATLYNAAAENLRPPLIYCLFLATTVARWPPLVSYILELNDPLTMTCLLRQNYLPHLGNLNQTQIHDFMFASITGAIRYGDPELLRPFFDNGLSPEIRLEYLQEPVESLLEYAVRTNQPQMVRYLLALGLTPDIILLDEGGYCPFNIVSLAAVHNLPGILRLLVSAGDNGLEHSWALFWTAKWGAFDAAETLLDLGVDVNHVFGTSEEAARLAMRESPDFLVGTALHGAAEGGQLEFARWLLKKGARLDIKNGDGHTPIELAIKEGHLQFQQLLDEQKDH